MTSMNTTHRLATGLALLVASALQSGCLTLAAYSMAREEQQFEAMKDLDRPAHAWASTGGGPVTGRVQVISDYESVYGTLKKAPTQVLTCARREAFLIPNTEQMRWQLQRFSGLRINDRGDWIASAAWFTSWPDDWAAYIRNATCRPDGAFTFNAVPAGDWLLVAEINSREPSFGISGGTIVKPVIVVTGQPLEVTLRSSFVDGPLVPR